MYTREIVPGLPLCNAAWYDTTGRMRARALREFVFRDCAGRKKKSRRQRGRRLATTRRRPAAGAAPSEAFITQQYRHCIMQSSVPTAYSNRVNSGVHPRGKGTTTT